MSGRPDSVDPRVVHGLEVRWVAEIVDAEGDAAAVPPAAGPEVASAAAVRDEIAVFA